MSSGMKEMKEKVSSEPDRMHRIGQDPAEPNNPDDEIHKIDAKTNVVKPEGGE